MQDAVEESRILGSEAEPAPAAPDAPSEGLVQGGQAAGGMWYMRYPRYDFTVAARSGPLTATQRLAEIRRLKEGTESEDSVASASDRAAREAGTDGAVVGSGGLFGDDSEDCW